MKTEPNHRPTRLPDACGACDGMRRAVADCLDDVRASLLREVDCLERELCAPGFLPLEGPARPPCRLRWPTRQPPEPPLDPAPPDPGEKSLGSVPTERHRSANSHRASRHTELQKGEAPKHPCYDTVDNQWGRDDFRGRPKLRRPSEASAEPPEAAESRVRRPSKVSRRSSDGDAGLGSGGFDFTESYADRSRALCAPQHTKELHTFCCWGQRARRARAIFTWAHFDVMMGVVIVLNAITIGIETSASVGGGTVSSFVLACEYVFLLVYIAELCLNFVALGVWECLANPWIKLDVFFVVIGVANVALSVFTPDLGHPLGNFNMLKVLRLIRLARIIRLAVQFRTLWLLSSGLIHAVTPMIWTCFFMVLVIYVFAVLGMEVITDTVTDGTNAYTEAAQNFSTLSEAMFTLWQIMFVDSAAAIYRPLMNDNPFLVLYFLAFFLMGPVALMNLVIAIMVESSFRVANEDQEAKRAWRTHKRKAMIPKLLDLFKDMDDDGNGELDLAELRASPLAMEQIQKIVDIDELDNLIHLLDQDGTGTISIDEFVEGLLRSVLDEKPAELVLLVGHSRRILNAVQKLGRQSTDLGPEPRHSR